MNLVEVLEELTKWCAAQPGCCLWTLMQTRDAEWNGEAYSERRGFQLLVIDHAAEPYTGWHVNVNELAELSELATLLRKARKEQQNHDQN